MPDPLTTNKSLAQPTRGSDSGTWDTPMNNNSGIIDNSFGGVATIALTNSPVALSSGQYQCAFIKLTGALTANCALTFPGGIGSFYTILNQTTNSSNFVVTMTTTAAGANTIGLPPGQNTKVLIDGTNPQYGMLPHNIGDYCHHGGSSTPLWITICTVPPYLNCDGSGFSGGTYPALAAALNGTTLPDARGRALFTLDQGTGRNGNGFLAGGGVTQVTLNTGNLPTFTPSGTISGTQTLSNVDQGSNPAASPQAGGNVIPGTVGNMTVNGSNFTFTGNAIGSNTPFTTISPFLVHGITLIRSG